MRRYGPGVTYIVPRRATINAPPRVGLLGGLVGDSGAPISKYPRGGLTLNPNPSALRPQQHQFESDPALGWLVPSKSKLYVRGTLGTKGDPSKIPAHSLRFAASPLFGMLDQARYSMNGTTIQSVSWRRLCRKWWRRRCCHCFCCYCYHLLIRAGWR